MSQETALITIEEINPVVVFTDEGIEPVIERIEKIGRELVPEISTSAGRQEIKSLAFKIARSKTLLDDAGKTYVADIKAKAKIVDSARKLARDRLDALKEEVRQPLTEWEEEQARIKAENERKEQLRVERIKELISETFGHQRLSDLHNKPSVQIQARIKRIGEIDITEADYQEFTVDADLAKSDLLSAMTELLHATRQREQEDEARKAEELRLAEERKRLEAIEQEQAKAREEESAKLKAEQERQDQERQTLEAEKLAFEEQKQREAEERQAAALAEQERTQTEEQAARKAAETKSEEERQAAILPDKEKMVAFINTVHSNAVAAAQDLEIESPEIQELMQEVLESIASIRMTVFSRCKSF